MRKTMNRLIVSLLTLSMVLGLAACGAPVEPKPSGSQSAAASSEESQLPITVVDQAGREVTLDKPAETIVSCYYITTYATMALGVSDRVVGLEKKAETRPIYHMAAPALLDKPNVGSLKEFNVEAAAALMPDLVLMPVKLKEHAQTLTDLGIPVLVVDPETQEDLEEMLRLVAALCGVEERAEALLSYYDEQLTRMVDITANAPKPKVYLGGNSSYLQTAPAAMYQSNLIGLAGGNNAAAELEGDYWTEVSYETILTWDPDVIVIPCGSSYTREDICNDENLADVTAVKNGAVYQMPQEIEEWDSPVPSGILGILWMTSALHGELYPFEDFQSDVSDYYREFYGFEIDKALVTK